MSDASDRVNGALTDAIQAGEMGDDTHGIPAKWVLVATHYDSEGDIRIALLTDSESRTHDTLGLLALGTAAWNEQAIRWVHDNQGD